MKNPRAEKPIAAALVAALLLQSCPAWSAFEGVEPGRAATERRSSGAREIPSAIGDPSLGSIRTDPLIGDPDSADMTLQLRDLQRTETTLTEQVPTTFLPPPAADAGAPAKQGVKDLFLLVGTKRSELRVIRDAVRVAKELGLTLALVDDGDSREESRAHVADEHFIAAPVWHRDEGSLVLIERAVAEHPLAARVKLVMTGISQMGGLTARLTDRLGAAGIASAAVSAAEFKPKARQLLNAVPELKVPFAELSSQEDARRAFREVSENGKYKVVVKSSRSENSRFLAVELDSEDAAATAYADMDAGLHEFAGRPEAKYTPFNSHPGIMMERQLEKLSGTEETSVDIIMQGGRPVFSVVSDTHGIGPDKRLAGGISVFPSQQPAEVHRKIVESAAAALRTLGISDGVARVDMMVTADGPKVVEINPFQASMGISRAIERLTGVNLFEQGVRALLGLPVDAGHSPDGVLHYIFLASAHTGTLDHVEGIEKARGTPGVVSVDILVYDGDRVVAAKGNGYEETASVMAWGRDWRSAIDTALKAARDMIFHVRKSDGVVRQEGDYLQPTVTQLTEHGSEAPGLFSKVVLGFFSSFILVQTAVESTALAVSQIAQPLSNGFLALALLSCSSYLAYAAGSFLGGRWVDRWGIRASYRTVLAARTVLWTGIAALFYSYAGNVPLIPLTLLISADYFAHSIGRLNEHGLQVAWYHRSPLSSLFGSRKDFIEYFTMIAASFVALAVSAWGFGVVVYSAPVVFGLATAVIFMIHLPRATPGSADAAKSAGWASGLKLLVRTPAIYKPMLGNILANSFLYALLYIVAQAFGLYVTGVPETATAVAGSLTGLFGVGALFGALQMERTQRSVEAAAAALPAADREEGGRRLYAASGSRALLWVGLAFLGSWAFVSQTQLFGLWGWPIFLISLPMLGIGFAAQRSSIHMDTIMKDNIPQDKKELKGSILGGIRAITYLFYMASFLLWGAMFDAFGAQAFVAFGAFYTAVAGIMYFWLAPAFRGRPDAR